MNYQIKKSKRAKRIRISLSNEGIVVTIPYYFSEKKIKKFLEEKEDWIESKIKSFNSGKKRLKVSQKDYLEKKEEVKELILKRISFLDSKNDFSFEKVFIKNQSSRWGSCSVKKNLNFNYRMIYLPENIFDYVIVHELCHLKEMNHSKNFWKLVSQYCPNYYELKKELKNYLL